MIRAAASWKQVNYTPWLLSGLPFSGQPFTGITNVRAHAELDLALPKQFPKARPGTTENSPAKESPQNEWKSATVPPNCERLAFQARPNILLRGAGDLISPAEPGALAL